MNFLGWFHLALRRLAPFVLVAEVAVQAAIRLQIGVVVAGVVAL
jgi:hypothetical protein